MSKKYCIVITYVNCICKKFDKRENYHCNYESVITITKKCRDLLGFTTVREVIRHGRDISLPFQCIVSTV
jgi:hypothetical protein